LYTTQAVIASEAKQSPSRKEEEMASSQKTLLAMTRAEQQLPTINPLHEQSVLLQARALADDQATHLKIP
jgi:hypothetical protein